MEQDIAQELESFLLRASKNSSQIVRQRDDLISLHNFWTDSNKRRFGRTKRKCFEQNIWTSLINQVVGKMSSSPYHIALDNVDDVQDVINDFEDFLGTKNAICSAFRRGVACGAGYMHVIFDEIPRAELIQNQTAVWVDPFSQRPDISDAREVAVVNFVANPEHETCRFSISDADVWNNNQEYLPEIVYYRKSTDGVHSYKFHGNTMVKEVVLPCSIIPVIRFAGYETYTSTGCQYEGVISRTYDLQATINNCFSQLNERCAKQVSSKIAIPVQSLNNPVVAAGLEAAKDNSSWCIPYDSNYPAPTVLQESFVTDDLVSVINNCKILMQDATGIMLPNSALVEKTATESLLQSESMEGSVVELFLHAEMACRSLAKIVIQCITQGQEIPFALEAGPAHITTNMKRRQALSAIAQLSSDEIQRKVIAFEYAKTLANADELVPNLRANMGDVQIVDEVVDIGVVAGKLQETEMNLNEALDISDQATQEANELKQENDMLNQQLSSTKEQFDLERQKMALDAQKKELDFQLKIAELQAKIAQMEAQTRKVNAEAEEKEIQNFVDEENVARQLEGGI